MAAKDMSKLEVLTHSGEGVKRFDASCNRDHDEH